MYKNRSQVLKKTDFSSLFLTMLHHQLFFNFYFKIYNS